MRVKFAFALVMGASIVSLANAQYQLGGPASSLTPGSGSWSWDGFELAGFRGGLENPNYFGPGGASPTSIQTSDLAALDAPSLAGLNGLVISWMSDSDATNAQKSAIQSFFLNGGDLFLLDDNQFNDPIGELLGLPSSDSDGNDSNGGAPFFDGVFGIATNVHQNGTTGQVLASDIAAHNGHVGGTNASGQVTSAYWDKNEYAPGAGRLVIFADVDMLSAQTSAYGTNLGDLNDNSRFALNAADFLVNGQQPVPEPATMAVLGLGALGLLKRRRK